MSEWRIDPAGVQGVLAGVDEARQELAGAIDEASVESMFAGLSWGGGYTAVVPEQLSALLDGQRQRLAAIGNRVSAGSLGVANATIAYGDGQLEMAGRFQAAMGEAAVDGDFRYFDEHGQLR